MIGKTSPNGQLLTFKAGEMGGLEGLDGFIELNVYTTKYWNSISVLPNIDSNNSTAYRHSKNPAQFGVNFEYTN